MSTNNQLYHSEDKSIGVMLYRPQKGPRYFEINKTLLKWLLYAPPTLTFICIIGLLVSFSYFKSLRYLAEKKEPEIFSKLRDENNELSINLSESENIIKSLEQKLSKTDISSSNEFSHLNFFKIPAGSADKTHTPTFQIKDITVQNTKNELVLNFHLHNLSDYNSSKKTGRLFIIARYNNSFYFFPENVFSKDDIKITYTMGEYFATSRFRPVKATFPMPKSIRDVLFQVVIFSQTGDLIHHEILSEKNFFVD